MGFGKKQKNRQGSDFSKRINSQSSKKIKVLIVAGAMNCGGLENQLMHLIRQANKNKFQIDYTVTDRNAYYKDEIIALGGECLTIPPTEGIHFLRYCIALYKVLTCGNYDIVHSHELFHSGMVLLVARIAGVKSRFAHAHNWKEGFDPKEKKRLSRIIYNYVMQRLIIWNATDYVACSTLAGQFLYGRKIIRYPNYHLVFNSVDTAKFIDNYYQKEKGEFTDDGWVNVIQVGRFTPVKNQLFTAKIVKELKHRGRKIRVLCAGNDGGEYEREVKRKIKEYDIGDRMLLLGIRDDIDVLLRKSSAFLLPTRYEGMPLVMIEAQASGLPCVTADTYSHEVDFDIGLIDWLDIESSVDVWADAVENAVGKRRPERERVSKAIEEKGYSSVFFAKRICGLYEQSVLRGETRKHKKLQRKKYE